MPGKISDTKVVETSYLSWVSQYRDRNMFPQAGISPAKKCQEEIEKQSRNRGAMCLSDTEKGFQTRQRLNNPSLVGAPKCRDRNQFPQAGQIAVNGDWNRRNV